MSSQVESITNPKIPFPLRMLFKEVPKTDLHVHIGGSTRKEDIETFMQENGIPKDEIPKLMQLIKPTYESTTDILDAYYKIPKHVYTPSQFKRATIGIVEEAAKDNVRVLEVRTSILNKGGEPKEIVEATEEGLKEGSKLVREKYDYDMHSYLTVLAQRFGRAEESMQTAKLAVELSKRPDSMICGFDLAGDESKHSIEPHKEALEYIKRNGKDPPIGLTVHAGETKRSANISGVESIQKAIEYGADRLAHALRLVDDEDLKRFVIDKQIPIEIPTWSHVQIKVVDSYEDHPFPIFLEEGMNMNLCTDNRLMSQITLRLQLAQLWAHKLITSWDEIRQLTTNGIKAAFLPETEKQTILKESQEKFDVLERCFRETIKIYLGGTRGNKIGQAGNSLLQEM